MLPFRCSAVAADMGNGCRASLARSQLRHHRGRLQVARPGLVMSRTEVVKAACECKGELCESFLPDCVNRGGQNLWWQHPIWGKESCGVDHPDVAMWTGGR